MAVSSIQLTKAGRAGTFASERKNSVFELTNRKYRKIFLVSTTDINDGPATIYASGGIPQIGDSYTVGNDTDALATCVSVDCTPYGEWPLLWQVTAEYDTDRLVDATITNPLNLPAELQWSFAKYEKPMPRDLLGVPIVNSAGRLFDPPVVADDSRPTLVISRNEATFNSANAITYQDAVNSDIFGPGIPGQAKINSITGVKQQDIGLIYYRVSYEIEFRRESYYQFVQDMGWTDVNGYAFKDLQTQAVLSNPTMLNGWGQRLTTGTTTLATNCLVNDTVIGVPAADAFKFPPLATYGTIAATPPPHFYFEVKVDNEIMQVTRTNAGTWSVTRGWAGTIPAAHAIGAVVVLQPYFLRFQTYKMLPFAPLGLPTS